MNLEQALRIVSRQDRAYRKYRAKRRSLLILGRAIIGAIQDHDRRMAQIDIEFEAGPTRPT